MFPRIMESITTKIKRRKLGKDTSPIRFSVSIIAILSSFLDVDYLRRERHCNSKLLEFPFDCKVNLLLRVHVLVVVVDSGGGKLLVGNYKLLALQSLYPRALYAYVFDCAHVLPYYYEIAFLEGPVEVNCKRRKQVLQYVLQRKCDCNAANAKPCN